MAFGPFFFAPVAHVLGRSSAIFWCLLGALVCQIWGALMTGRDDYIPFIMSRLFSGFFGAVPTAIGPRILTDMFFLHQRGRAFTSLHMAFLFGTIAGPTFSAFISANASFPVEFWWTVGLLGVVLTLTFLFLEETGFDRENKANNPTAPNSFISNRLATFFFGQHVIQRTTFTRTVRSLTPPHLSIILFSPNDTRLTFPSPTG
jgi:MFS family permease